MEAQAGNVACSKLHAWPSMSLGSGGWHENGWMPRLGEFWSWRSTGRLARTGQERSLPETPSPSGWHWRIAGRGRDESRCCIKLRARQARTTPVRGMCMKEEPADNPVYTWNMMRRSPWGPRNAPGRSPGWLTLQGCRMAAAAAPWRSCPAGDARLPRGWHSCVGAVPGTETQHPGLWLSTARAP